MNRFIVLGGGIAGFSAAKEIRKLQPDAQITVISAENELPYIRPLLSKTGLQSFQNRKILLEEESFYTENRITVLRNSTVESLCPDTHRVLLSDGTAIEYDKCVYALGAECFVPPVKGTEKKGVLTLRNTDDFRKMKRAALRANNAVVIGGGVIGMEIACELKKAGLGCTVLEVVPGLMSRQLDRESSIYLQQYINNLGIECCTGVQVSEIMGGEAAEGVALSDGREFSAELVIISAGVRAASEIALKAGLKTDRGVLTDSFMMTSDKDIFAAGDCVQLAEPNPGLWNYSKATGETAGHNAASESPVEFRADMYPLVLSTGEMALFAAGNTKEDGQESKTFISKNRTQNVSEFRVNRYEGIKSSYEKYFYRDGKLTGAVLIGNLSKMDSVLEQLDGGRE